MDPADVRLKRGREKKGSGKNVLKKKTPKKMLRGKLAPRMNRRGGR